MRCAAVVWLLLLRMRHVASLALPCGAAVQTSVPVLTTAVSIGASVAWLALAGLNITGGTDAGLRYTGGYSPRGLVEVADAANVVFSNFSVSQASRQQQQRAVGVGVGVGMEPTR